MSWFKIDDAFLDHAKSRALEAKGARMWADGVALWMAMGVFCGRNLTDGNIPLERIYRLTPLAKRRVKQVVPALVEVGMLRVTDTMAVMHDFLDYNPSRKQVLAKREAGAKRTRKHRAPRSLDHSLDHSSYHERAHELQTGPEQKQGLTENVTPLATGAPIPIPYIGAGAAAHLPQDKDKKNPSSSAAHEPREIPEPTAAAPSDGEAVLDPAPVAADDDFSAAPGQENPAVDPELQELLARAVARAKAADALQAAQQAAEQPPVPEPGVAPAPEPARPAQPSTERRRPLASHVRNDPYAHMPLAGSPPFSVPADTRTVCDAEAARTWAKSVKLSTRINDRSILEDFAAAQVTWAELLAAWKHLQDGGVKPHSVGYVMTTAVGMRKDKQARGKAEVQVPGEWQRELEEIAWEHMGLPGVPLPMAREIHRHHESMQQVRRLAGECATLKQLVARLRKPGAAHRCAADSTPQQAGEVAASIAAGGEG